MSRDIFFGRLAGGRPTASRRALLVGGVALLAAPALARAQPAVLLRLGDQKGGVEALLKASGQIADLPFRIEINQFVAAAPLLEALNAGAVDLAWAGDAPTTFALANGTPAKIVAAHRTTGAATALLVKPDSPIRTVADLKGKTIGTSRGSIGQALVLSALKAQGLPFNTVKFAFLLPAEAKTALESGAVDAWSTWGVFIAQGRVVDNYRVVVDGSNGILSGLSYLNALDSAIAGKRAAVAEIVRRVALARLWANGHVDDYARFWAGLVGVSFEVAKFSFETAPSNPERIDDKVVADQQATADLYTAAGLVQRRLDVRQFFDTSFNGSVVVGPS